MNLIFNANMQHMLDSHVANAKFVRRPVRLHRDSKSKELIEYLFKHGATSTQELMAMFDLKRCPACYLSTHIETKKIICCRQSRKQAFYSINPVLTRADFGLATV